ncbi:MAG: tetratricopeptide repeat protein [Anaerolineae bacterium]|nr:tetratricopeptide repeat protein [Anaerolineae bacterium]
MECPYCSALNPAQARFCLACGHRLTEGVVCATCHTLLPAHARYCFHCGALVIGAAGPESDQRQAPSQAARLERAEGGAGGATVERAPTIDRARAAVKEPSITAEEGAVAGRVADSRPILEAFPSLHRYLPGKLIEPLERRATDTDLGAARDHLIALLDTAKTYLPGPVIAAPQPPGEPAGSLRQGTFLFVDVSGFTPLSERLRPLGQAGAERITDIINDLFFELVTVLFDHGGTLLKFGGDALLGLFEAEDGGSNMAPGALRAVQAGLAMQATMGHFSAIEAAGQAMALRIKCGVSAGPYFAAHIGTVTNMAFVTSGHTVNLAEQAEGHAQPGDVVMAEAVRGLIGDAAQVEARDEGFYLVRQVVPLSAGARRPPIAERPEGPVRTQIGTLVGRLDRLAPYLNAELLSRIVTNPKEARIVPDHRPVTVMFANYVGVGDLIRDMGETHPELITHQLHDYFVHMAGIVDRYEGTLGRMDQYSVGDRIVVFFGAPKAHEDDPVRAAHAALDMQAATRKHFAALQTPAGLYRFRQRIGINTGTLFAGNAGAPDLRQEYTLMGDDINMAARLMSMAGWGEVLISGQTQKRVQAYFELVDRGQLKVKGKEILIPTFQVTGRRETVGRTRGLEAGETQLVNRVADLDTLYECGRRLLAGRGQVVAVMGDSGLGKSRLTRELQRRLFGAGDDAAAREIVDQITWVEGHAQSFSEQVSYWLATQMWHGLMGTHVEANPDDILFTLWEEAETLLGREKARDAVPFLANLLDLPLYDEWAEWVNELEPGVRQKQTFWAAREFLTAAARRRPLVIVLDDLHWADEASLALFENLLTVTDMAPLMFCLIFRERHDKGCWRLRDRAAAEYSHRYTEVALDRLDPADSRQLLYQLVPGAKLSPELEAEILDKTAGNPFYLEEVIRSLIASGALVRDDATAAREGLAQYWRVTDHARQISVPDTLQGAILARIDRLTEDARQALQMAAVIGRRFEAQVLKGLTEAEAEMERLLAQLERSDLIEATTPEVQGAALPPKPVYTFPDALVQEVAYESLLVQRREEFHARVGITLEKLFAGREEQSCELLAYHFGRSNDRLRAIRYLDMAAREAQKKFANETALEHDRQILALLGDDETQWQERFDVQSRRQRVLGLIGRQAEREADLKAMLDLAVAHGSDRRLADVKNELADLYQWTGRYAEAEEAAREALARHTDLDNAAGRAAALHQLGVLHYYRGDYDVARTALEQSALLRQQTGDAASEAWSTMYLGMIYFFQGDYAQAGELHGRALETARAHQDWYHEGIYLTNAARVALRLGEYDRAIEQFEQSLEMKRRVGDRNGQGFSLNQLGLTYIYLERYPQAEEALRASLALRQEIQDERGIAYCLHGLGMAALGQGRAAEAADHFQQAQERMTELGLKAERIVALSFLGRAHLAQGHAESAAEASHQALALLAEQKSVEEVQQVYLNHYFILRAAGDTEAAQSALEAAHQAMMEQAERIGDKEERARFLAQVKVNREIQEVKKPR